MKTLIALGLLAMTEPALANVPAHAPEGHKNMCTGLVAGPPTKPIINATLIMHWSLTNIHLKAGDTELDLSVTAIKGKMGKSDMVIEAEHEDKGSRAVFTMPLDGMEKRQVPDTLTVIFDDGTTFLGVCTPVK
jgi:hypothetical protein